MLVCSTMILPLGGIAANLRSITSSWKLSLSMAARSMKKLMYPAPAVAILWTPGMTPAAWINSSATALGAFFSRLASSKQIGVASSPSSILGVWFRMTSGGSIFHLSRTVDVSRSLIRACSCSCICGKSYHSLRDNILHDEDLVLRLLLRHQRGYDHRGAAGPGP